MTLHRRLCALVIGAAAVLLCFAPALFAGGVTVTVEHGCIGWDPGTPFVHPAGIFFDAARDECYVADTGNHQVVVCDAGGLPTFHFPCFTRRDGGLVPGEPKSIAVDASGNIYLIDDAANELSVLDATGRVIASVVPQEDACGTPESFEYVAIGPDGAYASTSCPRRHVAVIDGNQNISRVIQLQWKDASERACITGLAVDSEGGIYVTDACASEMVQMYDADGELLHAFGSHETGLENFSFASGIALTPKGNMWVVDTLRHVASLFAPDGTRLATVGGKGEEPGAMQYPVAVTTDGAGRVFVVERAGNRYQCFHVDGEAAADGQPDRNQIGMLLEEVGND